MTEAEDAEKERDDAQRALLFHARKRGLFTLGGTIVVAVLGVTLFHWCTAGNVPNERTCKVNGDCDGVLGVECLHAPTSTYCTHSCNRNEDCDQGFHCESPPWETNTTRLLCLKDIALPSK
ncbi:MAG: hypothetical protein ABI183_05795 [Polyangiaceae bacterium]